MSEGARVQGWEKVCSGPSGHCRLCEHIISGHTHSVPLWPHSFGVRGKHSVAADPECITKVST